MEKIGSTVTVEQLILGREKTDGPGIAAICSPKLPPDQSGSPLSQCTEPKVQNPRASGIVQSPAERPAGTSILFKAGISNHSGRWRKSMD